MTPEQFASGSPPGSFPVEPAVAAAVLVVLPVLYQVNSRIAPWGDWGDRDRYLPFWGSIAILHWGSAAAVFGVVALGGGNPASIGLVIPGPTTTAAIVVGGVVVAAVYYREVIAREPLAASVLERAGDGWTPATRRERLVGIFTLGITPGVCEEVVYRGFAVTALLAYGLPWWAALGLASVPFALLHGEGATASVESFASYLVLGVAFGAVFLEFGSIWPAVAAHAGYNLLRTAQGTRQYVVERPAKTATV